MTDDDKIKSWVLAVPDNELVVIYRIAELDYELLSVMAQHGVNVGDRGKRSGLRLTMLAERFRASSPAFKRGS